MIRRHGACAEFLRPDNMAEAIEAACAAELISVKRGRNFLAVFLRHWTGPRGGSVPLDAIADRIEALE